jgi:hypothetical protein
MIRLVDGKVIIDHDGLVEAVKLDQAPEGTNEIVTEEGNKASRIKRPHSDRWTCAETEQFYTVGIRQALQLFGTDFGMMSKFLAKRTRHQVKSKFKKESKLNPGKIDYALTTKIGLSQEAYQEYIAELTLLLSALTPST